MEAKKLILRPIALWVIVAGFLSMVTVFLLTFSFQMLSTVIGFLLLLLGVFLAYYEMGTFRPLWDTQEGEWGTALRGIGINVPFRIYYILLLLAAYAPNMASSDRELLDILLVLNVVTLLVEVTGFAVVYVKKSFFQPPKEEVEAMMRRVQTTVKAASVCPKCQEIVESEWSCCPNCGTELPKYCAGCGAAVKHTDPKCAQCGAEIAKVVAIEGLIKTLHEQSEQQAFPETRSIRYARYAEALLKGGRLEEAIEAYRSAIHYTQFDRKRTNFMVKMAEVYGNSGKKKEALDMLDAAMQLDPQDWAGAAKKKVAIMAGPSCDVKA